MITLALACGHNLAKGPSGSLDRGAVGNGVTEFDTTKPIVDALVAMKDPAFAFVKIPEGLDITGRCNWVKERRKLLDGIMEFHLDSASPTVSGCTTFFVDGNEWAAGMARKFQMAYTNVTGLKGRGIKPDTSTRFGRLGAIRDVPVFALLVELGFVSSKTDVDTIKAK